MTPVGLAHPNLVAAVEAELLAPVDEEVALAAADLRARLGDGVVAVLFYGSCLRSRDYTDKILDFYVLATTYRGLWGNGVLAVANHVLPPNVFYAETRLPGAGGPVVRSKYATLSLDHFEQLTGARTFNSSVWARFAQPARLAWSRDSDTTARVTSAVAAALTTTAAAVLPLLEKSFGASELWGRAFSETYRVELRSEGPGKGREIFESDRGRYEVITPLVLQALECAAADGGRYVRPTSLPSARATRWRWRLRRCQGKTLSLLRLIKAAFTFDGGIDYLAWKISRHSGVAIEVTPWQRRHPVLAGLAMYWKLRRKGAFR